MPGTQPLRKELLEAAIRYYQAMLAERADDPAVLADLALAHLYMSVVYHELDRNDDSLDAIKSALSLPSDYAATTPTPSSSIARLAGYWKVAPRRPAKNPDAQGCDGGPSHVIQVSLLWETFRPRESVGRSISERRRCH